MKNKEQKYTEELKRTQEHIEKTKRLILYHKEMLKKLEKKEAFISERLQKAKVNTLFQMLNKNGCDIDLLRNAIEEGRILAAGENGVNEKQSEHILQITDEPKRKNQSEEDK